MKGFKKALSKYDKYCNSVLKVLKKKSPEIEFKPSTITSGFVMGFSPSIVANALIKADQLRKLN